MLSLTSPVRTWHNALPAWAKLAVLAAFTMAIFPVDSVPVLALAVLLVAALHTDARLLRVGAGHLWPLWPFVAVIAVWHGLSGDWAEGAAVVLKLVAAVGFANLVTMTTRLEDMMAVVERLLSPLARLGLNTRALGLAVAMVIRFVPVLTAKGRALIESWRGRSARRPGLAVVPPLLLLAADDAERVAEALRARGGALSPEG